MIAIIDYGMGNIHSVKKALELCGAEVKVSNDPADIRAAKKLILPGVGAFDEAMLGLENSGLAALIKEELKAKKPLLGICLGMQLLFEESAEAQKCKGLGIIRGKVKRFPQNNLKVPHLGWNNLKDINPASRLLKGIAEDSFVYFCHSYYPELKDAVVNAASCEYGLKFSCALEQDNVFGVQFHPEKSQGLGLKILENFVNLC